MAPTRSELIDYIRQAAVARGIDPNVAVRVARSEGLNGNPADGWKSTVVKNGKREESYGPFQLFMGGGLGNVFQRQTGLDPRQPGTVFAQIDFALDNAARDGWGAWYGAGRVGISDREGLAGAKPIGVVARAPTFDPTALSSTMQGLGFAPEPWRGLPSMQAANAMATGGEMPEMSNSVPGVPVSGQPTQDQLQSRFYDDLFQPMQPNGPAWTAPPRPEMFNDAFGASAYPSREPRAFGPASPTAPAPISLPVPTAVNEYRQKAEENLRQAMSGQSQGSDMGDLMTLPSQMNQSGRPSYANQSLPPPTFPNSSPSMAAGNTGSRVRSTDVGPDPTYNDDAVIAAMDGGARSSYSPDWATAFGVSSARAAPRTSSPSAPSPSMPEITVHPQRNMPDFNERFNGTQLPGAGYQALTGQQLPTAASYLNGLGGFPAVPAAKPASIPAAPRLAPSRRAAIGTANARRAPPSPAYRAPASRSSSAINNVLRNISPQLSLGNISIPSVANQVMGQTYGSDAFSAYTPTHVGTQMASGPNDPGGGSQYSYTTGDVNGNFGGSYTTDSGTTISYWTDSQGNNFTTYS